MKHNMYIGICILFCLCSAEAKEPLQAQRTMKPAGVPNTTLLNINAISSWYSNYGNQERNEMTGNAGLTYPRGTSTAVYASGLMFGAMCNDGAMAANQPRVTGNSYNTGFSPGAILGMRTGVTEDPASADVRIWRIRRDYATADLRQDAAEFISTSLALLKEADVAAVRAQYRKDWLEWPASKGAPFYDANHDGIYTPQFEMVDGIEVPKRFPAADEPGLANADQVVWYVMNDIRLGQSPWKTLPIGLEQQVTLWGYNTPGAAGNIIFKKFRLIYKGTALTPVDGRLTGAYVTHWSDPDLGDSGDDHAGCDTTMDLGYVYNSTTPDKEYLKFNIVPPALGNVLLQGPIVPVSDDTSRAGRRTSSRFRNLSMTSFLYFAAGGNYSDPPFTLNGAWQWYAMMLGYPPMSSWNPMPPIPPKLIDPVTGDSSVFWLSGDPLSRTGWIDGMLEKAGDRRTVQTAGPFTMEVGDTQEVAYAVVGGRGENHLHSIAVMKENARLARVMFDSKFTVVPPAVAAQVTYPNAQATVAITAAGAAGQFSAMEARIAGQTLPLFDDGAHQDGAAGDGTFANSIELSRSSQPRPVDITATAGGFPLVIPKALESVTTAGPLAVSTAVHYDNINADGIVNNGELVRFGVTIHNQTAFPLHDVHLAYGSPVDRNGEREFGSIPAGASRSIPYAETNGGSFYQFRLPVSYGDSNFTASLFIRDSVANFWKVPVSFPVVKRSFFGDSLLSVPVNLSGVNDGQIGYVLYDPARKNEQYDIWYGGMMSAKSWTAVKPLGTTDYATITATMRDTNLVPRSTLYPKAQGKGSFTINSAKTQVKYDVAVSGLSGPVTALTINRGAVGTNSWSVFTIPITDSTAKGTWQIPDSLVNSFISGTLYLIAATAERPNGEIRGQISDGIIPRRILSSFSDFSGLFQAPEHQLIGASLYLTDAPSGIKEVKQIQPTIGPVVDVLNPEGTYRIHSQPGRWAALYLMNETNITIRFNNEKNWAFVSAALPAASYAIQVPFAAYKDTVRVMPVIMDANHDTLWNTSGNGQWDGKNIFDNIWGIVNDRTASGINASYYDPANSVFPPTSNSIKGRYINGANHILTNVMVVNEKNDGIPPAPGTVIRFTPYLSVKPGDIKRISLIPLGVESEQLNTIPSDFTLLQNYPNPFNPTTRIQFALPKQTFVSLKVYDIIGREVATLVEEVRPAGTTAVTWQGTNRFGQRVASGVYFYRMEAGSFRESRKMLLLK